MERVCEFCSSLRPIVYCKSDEAYLCLSCDAKVHLANSLSGRHLRTLLCNLCRHHHAYVQCLDHQILICRGCDQKLHDLSMKHQKRAIRSYIGCPSAKDFAALWGFEFNDIEKNAHSDMFASISYGSADLNQTGGTSIVSGAKFEGGSSSQQGQKLYKDQERQIILQQIIDLKRLQVGEESNHSLKINGSQETDISSSAYHTQKKYDDKWDQQAQNPQEEITTNVHEKDSPISELKHESLSSTFSQLDNLPSSPIIDSEFFWTCKSPLQSSQLWCHNIQDLGICEELIGEDDFNIPDVDLTFQNYEELFGGDQDPIRGILGDNYVSCSSIEKDISLDKSDIYNESTIEDSSEAASMSISQSAHEDKDTDATNAEIKGNSSNLLELEVANLETGGNVTVKYKEKKSQLREKQARHQSKKGGANVRKRVKGQISKAESY
ncbi:putative zinc finger protein [Senna tora]|uniref:Putative zinc finger protein n=1 Tax=Senna tora TaxID=362788 RepID=A0A834SU85_9FABA|nr:putative zinc finger protein [Senna tora]